MTIPRQKISPERQAAYYVGMGISVIGVLLFLSVFVTGAMNFGNFDHFEERGRSMALRAISGMVLMIAGQFVARIGATGLAGSGIMLDPEKAKEDLEPWNRMAGSMADDALSQIGVVKAVEQALTRETEANSEPREVVKVRCRSCQALNDEHAKFCDQCGAAL